MLVLLFADQINIKLIDCRSLLRPFFHSSPSIIQSVESVCCKQLICTVVKIHQIPRIFFSYCPQISKAQEIYCPSMLWESLLRGRRWKAKVDWEVCGKDDDCERVGDGGRGGAREEETMAKAETKLVSRRLLGIGFFLFFLFLVFLFFFF